MSRFSQYLIPCVSCGMNTSKAYARQHDGKCKRCATGEFSENRFSVERAESAEHRNARLIDSGYAAYAREEGYYDTGDY